MNAKNIAVVSYLTFIGWIIAYVSYNNGQSKSSLAAFHLRQSLGLMLTGFVLYSLPTIFGVAWASNILGIVMLILWILGIISAVNGDEKEIPLVGKYYQEWFKGIN